MNPNVYEEYRVRLERLASRLEHDLEALIADVQQPSGGTATGELSNVPWHLADMGSGEFQQELNATLYQNQEYLMNEIRAAQNRLDSGDYGRCESCHESIADERLKAIPYTRYCVGCADESDAEPVANVNAGRQLNPTESLDGPMRELSPDRHGR